MRSKSTAFAASFAIYFIPLWDPPAFDAWGPYLLRMLGATREPLDPLKLAFFLLVTAVLQTSTGLLVWWALKSPGWWRWFPLPPAAVAMIYAASLVPEAFLDIAPWFDPAPPPEVTGLSLECAVPGVELAQSRSSPGQPLARAGQALIKEHKEYALLSMPGCVVRPLSIPFDDSAPDSLVVLPGGVSLYRVHGEAWMLGMEGSPPLKLEAPLVGEWGTLEMAAVARRSAKPMLSSDGQWIAWSNQMYMAGSKPWILIRRIDSSEEIVLQGNHSNLGAEVLQLNMQDRTITLLDIGVGFRSLKLDGSLRWGPVLPSGYSIGEGTTFLGEGLGWVVSHVKRANDSWFFPWAPSETKIDLRLRRTNWLQSSAMHPSGKFLAFSSTEKGKATICVMRVRDKEVIFRRYVPGGWVAPTRNEVLVIFLGDRFFAYTDTKEVKVLRLPDS